MYTLYTFGYRTPGAREKLESRMNAGVLLIDARYNPDTSFRQWSWERLKERYGENYLHAQGLGNENYRETVADIKLHAPNDPEHGLPRVIKALEERDVCLLCACDNYQQCHLAVVVELLRQRLPDLKVERM